MDFHRSGCNLICKPVLKRKLRHSRLQFFRRLAQLSGGRLCAGSSYCGFPCGRRRAAGDPFSVSKKGTNLPFNVFFNFS